MSKRYPPIFNVILFALAVIFMLLNPISNMIPWLPEAIRTAVAAVVYALYDFFNAAGKFIVDTYNEYAIFTLHVAIIAIYGKYLFNKDTKIKYQEAIETINNDEQDDGKLSDAKRDYENITECLYILSAWVLSLITLNIILPNFYHFTILQCFGNAATREYEMIGALIVAPFMAAITLCCIALLGLIAGGVKVYHVLRKKQ